MITPPRLSPAAVTALVSVLERARDVGLLGSRPVEEQIGHSLGFVEVLSRALGWPGPGDVPGDVLGEMPVGEPAPTGPPAEARIVDLGSGAGVPGLVVACCWPQVEVVLADSNLRRCQMIEAALEQLPPNAAVVVHARAEDLGRDPTHRARASAVTARSFGPPAVVAECAAPLLVDGGVLVTSEPPDDGGRWAIAGADSALRSLGLVAAGGVEVGGAHYHSCRKVGRTEDRFPRRPGVPERRPLF